MKNLRSALICAASLVSSLPAMAGQTFTMTFNGIAKAVGAGAPDQQFGSAVLGFYNGDPVYNRDGAQNFGVTFTDNALAICPSDVAEDCKGTPPASPKGGSYVGTVNSESFDFTLAGDGLHLSDLNFYYYIFAENAAPSVRLFSGSKFIEVKLPVAEGLFKWTLFAGLVPPLDEDDKVTSVQFLAKTNSVVFDQITVTTTTGGSVPEPSGYALLGTGLALLAGVSRRRLRATP